MNLQDLPSQTLVPATAAFMVGLWLFVRGVSAYRHDARISSIATSRIGSLAAGEVRISGVVEPLVHTLVSPLQSEPCVWYRALARETGNQGRTLLREERAVEFTIRDATGDIRVVPRGARWQVSDAFDETSDLLGADPPGLNRRLGPATTVTPDVDREAAIAALLTVRPVQRGWDHDDDAGPGLGDLFGVGAGALERRTRYQEARIAPGDTITVMGYAQPYADAIGTGPGSAYASHGSMDDALAADLDAARASGTLATTAAEAWGNAAIPGFGIGQPVRSPELHPEAAPLESADEALADKAERLFEVPDHALVVTSGPGAPLTIYAGTPVEAEHHHDHGFLVGLGGAALATGSALVVAVVVTGRL